MNKLYRSEKNKKIAGVIGGRGIFQLGRITPQSHNCHLSHYDKCLAGFAHLYHLDFYRPVRKGYEMTW